MPKYSEWAQYWSLEPETVFMNHGSFGACPTAVQQRQQELRERLEREPVRFFVHDYPELMDKARYALSEFLNGDPVGLAFVGNATTGVNTVLRSLDLGPGDELLVTDHEYNACRNALDFVANRAGAKVVVVSIPFPLESAQQATDALLGGVTDRTRLALVDHITSPTGLVLPIQEIVTGLKALGVDTLVDGAHAPGMLPVDLKKLGAAYFTGNCHKWLCTPKGSALLYVDPARLGGIRPLTISHGANAPIEGTTRFRVEFDWAGTIDPTALMCIPDTIEYVEGLLPGGWEKLRQRNRALALEARDLLCDALQIEPPAPDNMIGSLAAVPLPSVPETESPPAFGSDPLQTQLREEFNIQVPIMPWPTLHGRVLRISAQLYNDRSQYEYLAKALTQATG